MIGPRYGWTSASRSIRGSSCWGGPSLAGGLIATMSGGMLSSPVGRPSRCAVGVADIDPSRWRPFTDHGQASPRQHNPTRTAPAAAALDRRARPATVVPAALAPRPDDLTDAEEARAAELEAAIVAEEREPRRRRARREPRRPAEDPPGRRRAWPSPPPTNTPTSRATSGGSCSSAVR